MGRSLWPRCPSMSALCPEASLAPWPTEASVPVSTVGPSIVFSCVPEPAVASPVGAICRSTRRTSTDCAPVAGWCTGFGGHQGQAAGELLEQDEGEGHSRGTSLPRTRSTGTTVGAYEWGFARRSGCVWDDGRPLERYEGRLFGERHLTGSERGASEEEWGSGSRGSC